MLEGGMKMLSTNEEVHIEENDVAEMLTFYEKIKLKNNIESLFNHYTGSYVFIEENPWTNECSVRGKFHVKYGIFSKFEISFPNIDSIREYAEYIESLAFLKNTCDENIIPILNPENQLSFLHNDKYITEEYIEELLKEVANDRKNELTSIKEEIKGLYNTVDEVDNDIKYKKEQIKNMEIKIKEVKEAAESFMSSLHYVTIKSKNSIFNKVKGIFVKEQVKLNA
jgi:uncharacterized protein YoxC